MKDAGRAGPEPAARASLGLCAANERFAAPQRGQRPLYAHTQRALLLGGQTQVEHRPGPRRSYLCFLMPLESASPAPQSLPSDILRLPGVGRCPSSSREHEVTASSRLRDRSDSESVAEQAHVRAGTRLR